MHCASCGLLIDDEVEELPGVISSATDTGRGRAVVHTAAPGPSPAEIAAAITAAGYPAEHTP